MHTSAELLRISTVRDSMTLEIQRVDVHRGPQGNLRDTWLHTSLVIIKKHLPRAAISELLLQLDFISHWAACGRQAGHLADRKAQRNIQYSLSGRKMIGEPSNHWVEYFGTMKMFFQRGALSSPGSLARVCSITDVCTIELHVLPYPLANRIVF
jgi:hypothetical protein